MPFEESFETVSALQERARELLREGYTVLVLEAACGHWAGYSAFRVVGDEEESLKLVLTEPAGEGADPLAIYRLD